MSDSVPALVLDDTVTGANAEPVHFANFPGLWLDGRPVAVSELGFADDTDVYALVDELGLPLERTMVAAGEGLMPEVANHVPYGVDASVGEEVEPEPSAAELAVAGNADVVKEHVATVTDPDELAALRAAEAAGKSRSSVLAAIDDRTAELAPEAEEEAGS